MTAIDQPLHRTEEKQRISVQSRNRLAGKILAMSKEINEPLRASLGGWRIVVGELVEVRQMIGDDLGLENDDG